LKKNADTAGGPHRGINCKFEDFSEFKFILKTSLGYESGGLGTCFDEKNLRQNLSSQSSFRPFLPIGRQASQMFSKLFFKRGNWPPAGFQKKSMQSEK
jgi:hypothetical protein